MPTPSESTTAIESRWLAPNADSDALTCSLLLLLLLLHNPAAPATVCSKKLLSYRNINVPNDRPIVVIRDLRHPNASVDNLSVKFYILVSSARLHTACINAHRLHLQQPHHRRSSRSRS
ncbi:hypothetical protein V9T40_004187 [Parthenolecanium corni]|uniref:Uncharacterized protein n=1 Tax=Parthenolecanium corni TaxID=536013 RepID=A0AAN9U1N8_9HEMI